MDYIIPALLNLLQPINILVLVGGVFIGLISGATPGISGLMAVVLMIPITYSMNPDSAILILSAVYCASVFSGSISAILFRTPGAPEAVATTLDGYEMTKKGKAPEALGISVFSSAVGGIIGTLILIFVSPQLAKFALKFASPEYFALSIVGLSVITVIGANNLVKSFICLLLGLFLATVGIDPMSGVARFTFGSNKLMSGLDFVPVLIGLFAISEVLRRFQEKEVKQKFSGKIGTTLPKMPMIRRLSPTILRSSLLGTAIGILPGIGATTAAMVSYSEAVRWSKNPDQFGKGVEEGLAAPESANNAAASGAMVPLLALGIPGSGTTAVILGAFIMQGIQPGPLLFKQEPLLITTLFIGLIICNILILLMATPFIRIFSNIIKIPYSILGTMILLLCIIGSFAIRNNILDVWMTLAFGIFGYLLEEYKFPLSPIVLGMVLGTLVEQEFRRSLVMSSGDWRIFIQSPITITLFLSGALLMLFPLIKQMYTNYKKKVAKEV